MVRKSCAHLGQFVDELWCLGGYPLHVAAVAGMQNTARHLVTNLVAVSAHLRTFAQNFEVTEEMLRKRPTLRAPASRLRVPRDLGAGLRCGWQQLRQRL